MDLHTHAMPPSDITPLATEPPRAPRTAAPASLVLVIGTVLQTMAEAADLRAAGVRSICVATPEQGFDAAPSVCFDGVVLHAPSLAGPAGIALSRLRDRFGCPIVLVADQADEVDEILALELGADAFLVRPISPRRLRAHLMRLLARRRVAVAGSMAGTHAAAPQHLIGRWKLDRVRGWLSSGARLVRLTEGQTALLLCLAEARGSVVPRRQLLGVVNSRDELADRSVDVYVSRLRRLLVRHGVGDIEVITLRGRGYALHLLPECSVAH
jgi:two-component system, OmpR family, response regulator